MTAAISTKRVTAAATAITTGTCRTMTLYALLTRDPPPQLFATCYLHSAFLSTAHCLVDDLIEL